MKPSSPDCKCQRKHNKEKKEKSAANLHTPLDFLINRLRSAQPNQSKHKKIQENPLNGSLTTNIFSV